MSCLTARRTHLDPRHSRVPCMIQLLEHAKIHDVECFLESMSRDESLSIVLGGVEQGLDRVGNYETVGAVGLVDKHILRF